jgi:predicted Rossmann fold nucleotide-binding protein DprA/Smf involved in DNA uptake
MKTIIAGGRDVPTNIAIAYIQAAVAECGWQLTEVIHGAARGVDSAAALFYEGLLPVRAFPADWSKHGNAAGPIRNRLMADNAEALIAIWDGKSSGTKNMIDTATTKGLKVYVYRINTGIKPAEVA